MHVPLQAIVNFLFETGILAKTPRSGFHFLGSGKQSVAEHTNRTVFIGYVLASLHRRVDAQKIMIMCLFHDFAETRVSDLNYVHQQYVTSDETRAMEDILTGLPFEEDVASLLKEYHLRKTPEARLAKDADNLEWMLSLKEQYDVNNTRAKKWAEIAYKRLQTMEAKKVGKLILETASDEWWFSDKDDKWWVSREKEKK